MRHVRKGEGKKGRDGRVFIYLFLSALMKRMISAEYLVNVKYTSSVGQR